MDGIAHELSHLCDISTIERFINTNLSDFMEAGFRDEGKVECHIVTEDGRIISANMKCIYDNNPLEEIYTHLVL